MTGGTTTRLAPIVAALRAAGCVFAEDEARLLFAAASTPGELADMVAQRAGGTPLEQVVGWAQFCGRRVVVEPGVFVPRVRSEFLVQQAVAVTSRGAAVVDVCCGSGAVGAAVAAAVRGVELYATDVDQAAVRCARRNLAGVRGRVYLGDLYESLPQSLQRHVDVVVANAPYVPSVQIALLPAEARLHEPRVALDGGDDGLAIQRRIVEGAPQWLRAGGRLLIETSERQAPTLADVFARSGFATRVCRSPDLDATVVVGSLTGVGPRWPASGRAGRVV